MKRRIEIESLTRREIQRVAEDLYIYGYPLLLMDIIKRTQTATPHPMLHRAPLNQFAHGRFLPRPHDKYIVHPNADGLCSYAWVDLRKEPVLLSIPRTDKYHILSFFSGWYEIFETSSPRNGGTQGGHVGFVAPHWCGKLPVDVKPIVAPTETVWIHGWFEVGGPEDIEIVHHLQDQFRLSPLSEWGSPRIPHGVPFRLDVDQKTTPQEQVANFDARGFYTRLSRLMQRNPAQACDAEIVSEFARLGFFPRDDFAFQTLPANAAKAMHQAVPGAQLRIANAEKSAGRGKTVNNWSLHVHPGRYEMNYLDRAVAARTGVVAGLAEDVLCFHTAVDLTGEPLKGAHRYVINLSQDSIPPVNAFWSITLYDSGQHLVSNSILRNAIGDRDRLRLNADNSLSIHIQHEWPGATRDSNWLPAPRGAFGLALRMYWPKPDAFGGSWRPPAVMRAN
ncbi:MAG TPA: DUF1254 domain-containing protein [Terriglobia bacterium]|nr:DUF1254 domain-containing protein [Terriglobia bacterium]